jgi:hypothetical protein
MGQILSWPRMELSWVGQHHAICRVDVGIPSGGGNPAGDEHVRGRRPNRPFCSGRRMGIVGTLTSIRPLGATPSCLSRLQFTRLPALYGVLNMPQISYSHDHDTATQVPSAECGAIYVGRSCLAISRLRQVILATRNYSFRP